FFFQPTSELEEQVRRLDNEKESLALQVAVLTDQVEAQAEKIAELEKLVAEQKRQISASDDMLQREMLTRSSLETQKLELLAVVSELKRREASLERDNLELREERRRTNKPPLAPRPHPSPAATSTPQPVRHLSSGCNLVLVSGGNLSRDYCGESYSALSLLVSATCIINSGVEVMTHIQPTLLLLGGGQYRSLPRERSLTTGGRRVVAFADMERHERTASVPNLAETESIATNDSIMAESIDRQVSPSSSSAAKGIRKIFGRLKRSGSGNLDDLPSGGEGNFVRGGIRSTAGPRLCTTSQSEIDSTPFPDWTVDRVCDWLRDLGLECCVTQEARNWIKSGSTLLSAPPHEVDKELNVKAGILRKKLHLALHCQRGEVCDPLLMASCRLDHCWVVRWLDDIGLPQYKNSFLGARLDGRMLHRLTVDDVHSLHVTSALHVASIRTGIHVLRKENFDPNCLIRRSDPDSCSEERVELWTNHRVMEWLRVVDLAEYAPNLRGSGVHGGLMVHEDRFNATLLASLLSIPPEKTLLRRHLSTHFTQLVGPVVIQSKRLAETSLGYIPLTTSLKIKVPKKGQFTLKRKKNRFELDDGELVCPLVEGGASSPAASHIPGDDSTGVVSSMSSSAAAAGPPPLPRCKSTNLLTSQ
ncbi:hypothetical protein AAG570_005466, partial [Ranatra chinensis]